VHRLPEADGGRRRLPQRLRQVLRRLRVVQLRSNVSRQSIQRQLTFQTLFLYIFSTPKIYISAHQRSIFQQTKDLYFSTPKIYILAHQWPICGCGLTALGRAH
jgi:hypothetical protein